jgi:WD40 repeat protein
MFYRKNREIDRQNWQLMEIQSTVVGELAHQLAESGDRFMASMLALEMLPRNLEDPERPYSPQADMALRAASVTRGGMFKGHDLAINGAIVARNLDFLITASSDMSIKMWDMCTGACLNTLCGHEYPVGHIELNQDETLLVSDDYGGVIKVWDMTTLECLSTIDTSPTGNLRWVDTSFDASGKKLRCFADRTLKTYDPITGECVSSVFFPQMKSYDDFVWVCGNYLMTTTTFTRRYDLWDIETQQKVKTYEDVRRMSIGQDKKFVEVIDDEGVLSVYSLESGQCKLVIQVDDFNYSLSPDFEKIALAVDGVAYIMDLRSGGIVSQFEISGVDADIIWTHDVKSIITIPSGAAYAEINDIEKESQAKVVSNSYGNGMHVKLSPNEEMLAYAIEDTLRIVSLNSGDAVLEIINDDLTYAKFDFSPDNEYFIRASYSSSLDRTDSRRYVNIYDITDASTVRTIEMECQAESFAFSHDGRLLAVGTRAPLDVIYQEEIDREIIRQPTGECYIYMIDLSTGTLLSRLDGHHGAVTSLQFSSDDKTLVSSSNDRSIVIWDVRTYSKVQVLEGHNDVVRNVFLIEDDTRAVSSSWDGTLRVWDIDSGACEQIVRAHGQNIIDVVVADDLSYFATLALDYTKVWSLEKMECVSTFGHVDDLSFVPDGNYVLTSRYGDVSMSHLSSGVCVDVFEGVGSEFDYSSSGSVVASAGKNGVLLFRIKPLQELIDRMQDLYKHRQFTPEERIKYNLVGR